MKEPSENPSAFEDSVELMVLMTPQEAVQKLAMFHDTTAASVLNAFMNLREFNEGSVRFKEGTQNGWNIIVMEGFHPDGQFAWNELIDRHTGQPITRTA